MNKTLLALALGGLLSFSSTTVIASSQESIQSNVEYSQFTSKRQVVDQLLSDAVTAFKSPARISHAGFTAKMPSNMEVVTNRLLEAYQLEPYRTDLLISAANAQIYNKNADRAIALFEQVLDVAPQDVDAHSYLAVWQHFNGNEAESQKHMNTLKDLNEGRAADIQRIFDTVNRIVATPLKETLGKEHKGNTAIITLGYALNPDGSMHEILIQRLEKTLEFAKKTA